MRSAHYPELAMRYPLAWPADRPRTRTTKPALFRHDSRRMTLTTGRQRLLEQMAAMTRAGQSWRTTDLILSCNIRFTLSGARDQNVSRRDPDDTGVAFYFSLDGRPHVLACDRWDTVQDNVAAIAAHIDALRGQERWGVADLRQAFAGHAALPPPHSCWDVLGVRPGSDEATIAAAYRQRATVAHPDRGGSAEAMAELNRARDEARAYINGSR